QQYSNYILAHNSNSKYTYNISKQQFQTDPIPPTRPHPLFFPFNFNNKAAATSKQRAIGVNMASKYTVTQTVAATAPNRVKSHSRVHGTNNFPCLPPLPSPTRSSPASRVQSTLWLRDGATSSARAVDLIEAVHAAASSRFSGILEEISYQTQLFSSPGKEFEFENLWGIPSWPLFISVLHPFSPQKS
ncbi:hypothetical protein AABB24_014539, partial [Solanum stoloniferum]